MRKLLAILQIFVLMAAMALPTAFAAEAPIMLAGLEAASSSSSTEAQHDWDTNLFFQTMQEKTGIAFSFTEYVSREAWTEAKTEMLAGEVAMPDMFFKAELTPQETLAFYEAGKLIDLRPYLAEYAPHVWALLEANPEWLEAVSLPDGAIVALPSINELTPNNTMWINKTWLDRLKMGVPTTAEELTEVLRQFRDRDMNQNGSRNDEIPLSFVSMWDLRFLAHAFGINADDYYLTEQNGKISEVLTTEENRAFLTWLHELYTEGLLDSQGFMAMRLVEAATSSSSSSNSNATAKYGVFFGATPQDVVGVNLASEYIALDPLVYNGQQVYRDFTGDLYRGTFAISSTCAEPEKLLQWVDYLYTDEGFLAAQVGKEGEDYDWNDDGTWAYARTAEEVIAMQGTNTIWTTSMPSYASAEIQMKMDDDATHALAAELVRVRQWEKRAMPLLYLTQEQMNRVTELQSGISTYAETRMAWFVAGDVELNDETWADFCTQVKALGIDEMVSIWQNAHDNAWHLDK